MADKTLIELIVCIGDRVEETDEPDLGCIVSVDGPDIGVDWQIPWNDNGRRRVIEEHAIYKVYDLTWDAVRKAWTIPHGFVAQTYDR